jgi:hypothetical protein
MSNTGLPDGGPIGAEESTTLLSGSSKDNQRKVASLIEDALIFLRTTARTNDYFTGYSLAEIITEKLSLIGKEADDDSPGVFIGSKRTLISQLNYFQEALIGEDGESGAIGAALDAEALGDIRVKTEDD